MELRGVPAVQAFNDDFRIEYDNTHGCHATLTQLDYRNPAEKRLSAAASSAN
jgi:hypothetical protein